jgi:hypothetical protein
MECIDHRFSCSSRRVIAGWSPLCNNASAVSAEAHSVGRIDCSHPLVWFDPYLSGNRESHTQSAYTLVGLRNLPSWVRAGRRRRRRLKARAGSASVNNLSPAEAGSRFQ